MNFIKIVFIFVIAFVSKSQGQDDLAGTFLSGNFIFITYREKVCTHCLMFYTSYNKNFSYCKCMPKNIRIEWELVKSDHSSHIFFESKHFIGMLDIRQLL